MIRPYFFGPPERQLFGIHASPEQPTKPVRGVVVCYPWGHEYSNSHRVFRVLANRLARQNYHVLRFDYHGTGDSPGDPADARLARLLDDVQQAIAELARGHGVDAVSLVGLRLGGSLALLAAAAHGDIERVVAWEAVSDGSAYVDQARAMHESFLESNFPGRSVQDRDQILGYRFTPALAEDLGALDLSGLETRPAAAVMLLSETRRTTLSTLHVGLEKLGSEVVTATAETGDFWANEIGVNQAAVPREALERVLEFMEATP